MSKRARRGSNKHVMCPVLLSAKGKEKRYKA
jgi:hypothetical protein